MSTDRDERHPDAVGDATHQPPLSRRAVLLGAAALVATAGCSSTTPRAASGGGSTSRPTRSVGAKGSTTTVRPTTTTSIPPGGPATFADHGPSTSTKVALTFHTDGDVALAGQLLDLLAKRQVRVTTFLVGKWVDAHPDIVRRIKADGHELANHTYSHVTFGKLAPAAMAQEVQRCHDALMRATGTGGRLFRPSGTENGTVSPGSAVLTVAGAAGYPVVAGFDVDPMDYRDPGAAAVGQRVAATVHPGAVISLHFGHPGTIAALPAVLDGLATKGLTPVTASELLS